MESIIVTGANGFFASRLCEYYKHKYMIIPLKKSDLDVSDEISVFNKIKKYKPDYVVHTAAIADTKMCAKDPKRTYVINVLGTENIAKACERTGAKMIFLSSEQVYNGNVESGPYSEDSIPLPNTEYGMQKLEAEKKALNILEQINILRLTWLFGFPEKGCKVNANIIWNVINAVFTGKRISVPCNEYRGMTYVCELISNFEQILQLPYGIYNTGSENDLSTFEIASEVLKSMGIEYRTSDILIKDNEKYNERCRDLRIDNSKLKGYGIVFSDTKRAIQKCIEDFYYKF